MGIVINFLNYRKITYKPCEGSQPSQGYEKWLQYD